MLFYRIYILILFLILPEFAFSNKKSGNNSDLNSSSALLDSLLDYKVSQPDKAIKFAMKVLQRDKYATGLYPKVESSFYNHLGEIYIRMNLPSQALSYFIEAKRIFPDKKTPWLDVQFGNVYYQQREWIKSKEAYEKALEIFSSSNIDGRRLLDGKQSGGNSAAGKTTCLSNLGRVEMQLNNHESALYYFESALEIQIKNYEEKIQKIEPQPQISTLAGLLNPRFLLANLYYEWGMLDLAMKQIAIIDLLGLPAIEKIELNSDLNQNPSLNRVLGLTYDLKIRIYTEQNNFEASKDAFFLSLKFLKEWPIYLSRSYASSSKSYFKQDSLYKSLEQIDKGLRICQLKGLDVEEIDLLQLKMDLLEKSNLNKSAVDVAVDILNKKSILDEYRMSGIIESVEIKSELYRSRNQLLDSKRNQRFLQIVVGVLMLVSGLIVISYRNKKRHSEQVAIINEQENQIAQVELKNKEAELVNLSTFALSKNDMLVNIVKDLDYHATLLNTKDDQKSLKPLKKKIQNFIDEGLNWEDYKVQFTNVYPNFVDSLISYNKEISNNDIKLCCYLKMNMNTKDIAQLFGLTVRAIENKRYRLRKKLKLETETSLMTFINGLN